MPSARITSSAASTIRSSVSVGGFARLDTVSTVGAARFVRDIRISVRAFRHVRSPNSIENLSSDGCVRRPGCCRSRHRNLIHTQ